MGIDIYARWPGQTAAETDAQRTGFSIKHGHVGYLREACHGEPYATRVLVPEAFDHDAYPDGAPVPAKTLRQRLPNTLAAATRRQQLVYNEGPEHRTTRIVLESFSDFVELCERKERETGQPCSIVASY
jgi:hypothetical protein